MSKPIISYEFAGLRLFPETQQLEILSSGAKINLSPTHSRFLLALVQKPQETISYEELRLAVWSQTKDLDASLLRLMQTTKGGLIKTLKQAEIKPDFIEVVPKEGYRLNSDVFTSDGKEEFHSSAEKSSQLQPKTTKEIYSPKQYRTFILSVSFFYGLLFWSALFLESAYKFQDFRTKIYWFTLPFIFWNGAVMCGALFLTRHLLRKDHRFSFFIGITTLIIGASISCFTAAFILPDEPITEARFQTQPAISAFIKNVWMYFLPLGIFLILLPFYTVCGKRFGKKVITVSSSVFFGLWFLALVYSLLSTFYLLDNLLPSENHGLFVIAAFLRFLIYFGLGIAVLFWYFSQAKDLESLMH